MGIKPYYDDGHGIIIYNADCRLVLPTLPKVDCVVADPPYGETACDWDQRVGGWMDKCESISKSIWCFGSLQMFMEMARLGECGRWVRSQEIVWEKHNGSGFQADRFKRVHELVVHFYQGRWDDVFKEPQYTADATARTVRRKQKPPHLSPIAEGHYVSHDGGPRMMRSVIYARSCHGDAEHPTQKPVEIVIPLLRYSCPAVGIVCDPFMGSGTTLVAAKRLGLSAIGIEIEEKYCEIAARRIHEASMPLFDVPESVNDTFEFQNDCS